MNRLRKATAIGFLSGLTLTYTAGSILAGFVWVVDGAWPEWGFRLMLWAASAGCVLGSGLFILGEWMVPSKEVGA